MEKIISILKTLDDIYRYLHLNAKGGTFYSDHLLFKKLYEPINDEIDGLIELSIALDSKQSSLTTIRRMDVAGTTSEALELENDLLSLIETYQTSKGLDNALGTVAENHLRNCYLIKRLLGI